MNKKAKDIEWKSEDEMRKEYGEEWNKTPAARLMVSERAFINNLGKFVGKVNLELDKAKVVIQTDGFGQVFLALHYKILKFKKEAQAK